MADWIVIDRGRVPVGARRVEFTCVDCGHEALLPVLGLPIAQIENGIVFDPGDHGMPAAIECPACGRKLEAA
jgi:predicted RNA-binding Zn-ribbon protein involved in translation (DUF1610 family)